MFDVERDGIIDSTPDLYGASMEKYRRVYARDFIINLNDPNLSLPAGFKRYYGMMKDDPPQIRTRMKSVNNSERSSYGDREPQTYSLLNQQDFGNQSSAVQSNSNWSPVVRSNKRDTYENYIENKTYDNNHYPKTYANRGDRQINFISEKLFDKPSLTDMINYMVMKDPEQVTWYYRDISNHDQGPFEAKDMQEWYKQGYFPPTLMVKAEYDTHFQPLVVLVSKMGNIDKPFLANRYSRLAKIQQESESTTEIVPADDQTTMKAISIMNIMSKSRFSHNLLYRNRDSSLSYLMEDQRWENKVINQDSTMSTVDSSTPSNMTIKFTSSQESPTSPLCSNKSSRRPSWAQDTYPNDNQNMPCISLSYPTEPDITFGDTEDDITRVSPYSNKTRISSASTRKMSKYRQSIQPYQVREMIYRKAEQDNKLDLQIPNVSEPFAGTISTKSASPPGIPLDLDETVPVNTFSWANYARGSVNSTSFPVMTEPSLAVKSFREIQEEEERLEQKKALARSNETPENKGTQVYTVNLWKDFANNHSR